MRVKTLFALACCIALVISLSGLALSQSAAPARAKPAPRTSKSTEADLLLSKRYVRTAVNDLGNMGAIYQAMYAMLKQALDTKEDKMKKMRVAKQQKISSAKSAAEAKKEEIRKKVEAARDQYISACLLAVVQCVSSTASIAVAGAGSSATLQGIPSSKFLRSYRGDIKSVLKRSLTLQKDIKKLIEDHDKYPYTSNQKRKMRALRNELVKVMRHSGKSRKTALDMAARIDEQIRLRRRYIPKR